MEYFIKGDKFGVMQDRTINLNESLLNDSVFSEWAKAINNLGKEKTKLILDGEVCKYMSFSESIRISQFISSY